jgi:hypothetical protein
MEGGETMMEWPADTSMGEGSLGCDGGRTERPKREKRSLACIELRHHFLPSRIRELSPALECTAHSSAIFHLASAAPICVRSTLRDT